jgi:hypothetical protein
MTDTLRKNEGQYSVEENRLHGGMVTWNRSGERAGILNQNRTLSI